MSSTLTERISTHANYFDKLISCIPAKLYLGGTQEMLTSRFMHKKNSKEQLEIKEKKKQARLDKLDPDTHLSTVEKQVELSLKPTPEPTANSDNVSGAENGDVIVDKTENKSACISELRQRLQAKIEELSSKRGQAQNKLKKGRDQVLEERRKDKIARQKAMEARKSQLEKPSAATTQNVQQQQGQQKRSREDGDENISFGKIKFEKQESKKQRMDPKAALKKLEAEKEKMEKIKTKDEQKAKEIKESKEWARTLALAAGEKLQDDEKKLKKAIKRKDKKVEKSKKAWEERKDSVQKSIEKKQQKRTENIQKRKDAKKAKKKAKRGF